MSIGGMGASVFFTFPSTGRTIVKHPTKLTGAKMRATKMWPACAFAILSQKAHPRKGIGTMAVDSHWRLYYDPEFIEKTPIHELAGVLLHETAHLLLKHHKRSNPSMDFQLWNVATDLAINCMLHSAGIALPSGVLMPSKYDLPDGKSAEWYYRELTQKAEQEEQQSTQEEADQDEQEQEDEQPEESEDNSDTSQDADSEPEESDQDGDDSDDQSGDSDGEQPEDSSEQSGQPTESDSDGDAESSDQPGQGQPNPDDQDYEQAQGGGGSCSDGVQRPWELPSPVDGDGDDSDDDDTGAISDDDADDIIKQVAERAEQAGKDHGSLQGYLDEILRPKIDPKRLLLKAIRKCTDNIMAGGDGKFSYRRPSRRPAISSNFLRPRNFTPTPRIKILIDTSGSMGKDDYMRSLGLVSKCLNSLRLRDGIEVVTGDTRESWAGKVYDHSKVCLAGGGGTDMGYILQEITKAKVKPDLIIVCTDGYTGWCDDIGIPVVACLTQEPSQFYQVPKWITKVSLN